MSTLGYLSNDAELFQHISLENDFNFVSLDGLLHTGEISNNNNLTRLFEDDEDDIFSSSMPSSFQYNQDEYSGAGIYGIEVSFEASMPVGAEYNSSGCSNKASRFVDIFEDAAAFEESFDFVMLPAPTKGQQQQSAPASATVVTASADEKSSEEQPQATVKAVVVEAPTVKKATSQRINFLPTGPAPEGKRVRHGHAHTLLFKDVAESSVAPTHFEMKSVNKEAVLYTVRDHCGSHGLSYTYSPADSTFHVTTAATTTSTSASSSSSPCEFNVRLYATEECDAAQKSTYVIEACPVYGDHCAFAREYSALRDFLSHDCAAVSSGSSSSGGNSKTKGTAVAAPAAAAHTCESSSAAAFYSQARNKAALAELINIPSLITAADATTTAPAAEGDEKDTNKGTLTLTDKQLRDARLRGAANLLDVSRGDPGVVDILLELGAVAQLLCIFRGCGSNDTDNKSNNNNEYGSGETNAERSNAVRPEHELVVTALKALRNLAASSSKVQALLAADKPFLRYVYAQLSLAVVTSSGKDLCGLWNGSGSGDGAESVETTASRDILRELSGSHAEQVCRVLEVQSLTHLLAAVAPTPHHTRTNIATSAMTAGRVMPTAKHGVVRGATILTGGSGSSRLKLQNPSAAPFHLFADSLGTGGLVAPSLCAISTK